MASKSNLYSRYFTYIKPLTKLPIIKNYGSTIFTLLTVSILTLFAIKPIIETILVLQKTLADQEVILQKVTQKADNLSLGKKNYDNLDQIIKEKISAAIPDTVSLKSLVQTLEQTAAEHEASVSAIQLQPFIVETNTNINLKTLTEISFTFNTEGAYKNLIAILQDLKTSSRLISVNSLSVSKKTDNQNLIMSLTGKAYYLK